MEVNAPNLVGLANAKEMARKANFTQGPNKISDMFYEWTNPASGDLTSKVRIDTVNYSFNISSNYLNNSAIISGQDLKSPSQSIEAAKSVLTNLNSFPSDIDPAKTQTVLLSIKNGALTTATSLSSTQVIKVIFYQQDINKLPLYYEKPDSSNIDVLVGPGDKILEANYIHQTITDQFATYPLKTTNRALEDLKQGYAYIASYQGNSANVSIDDVLLAYYVGTLPQPYLMPIMVFKGNDNFVAYIPAVTDEWISK
jgi:hypothetical protein